MSRNLTIGAYGQNIAKKYLQAKGYRLLAENYHCRLGEIDLICQNHDQLVFIEVKTRSSEDYGLPEEAITDRKKAKIHEAALEYLQQQEIEHDNFRIDGVAVVIDQDECKAKIRHHKNIVS